MKTELSAGGIVVRLRSGRWEVLVLQDMNDAWTFPKGNIGTGEDPETAARREIQEEVGPRDIHMRTKLPVIRYMYQRNGLVSKTVQYFIFESKGTEPLVSQTEEGIHNARWMSLDTATQRIGYPKTNKVLLAETKLFLWTLHPRRT
jgi:8-oxo-dGTP pyrophosphatase MutT (NUDIX family)